MTVFYDSTCFFSNIVDSLPLNQDFISLPTAGTNYIYETTSTLVGGFISKYRSSYDLIDNSNWCDLLNYINITSLHSIFEELNDAMEKERAKNPDSSDDEFCKILLEANDALLLSFLTSIIYSVYDLEANELDIPLISLLLSPEVIDYLTPQSPVDYDNNFIMNLAIVKNDYINYITLFSASITSYVIFISIVYSLLIFYFYTNNKLNSSELSSDNEYISVWALSESEKELGSADDLIFLLVIVVYIFGWFFGSNFYFILSKLPEFTTFMYSIPGIFYVVFSVPTYLLYDYGLFYGTYLRGASVSSFFIYELGYDIIMISVFYIRLALQAIRLVLMFIACASYYDYILFYNYKHTLFIDQSSVLSDSSSILTVTLYWFLFKIPGTLLYIAYEVLHLWFILISQTLAFFAMIFWLFLYLYSFFLVLTVENYFKSVRSARVKTS